MVVAVVVVVVVVFAEPLIFLFSPENRYMKQNLGFETQITIKHIIFLNSGQYEFKIR